MSELWTENPLLAAVYDVECDGREDHDFYLSIAAATDARSVVDLGCGTGVFAVDLARRGPEVIGLDPAAAMLDIARRRDGSKTVRWILGEAADVLSGVADLAIMMGHVAQYFVSEQAWSAALSQLHRILSPGGSLAFEVRNPAIDWAGRWTREATTATLPHPDGGAFTSWVEVIEVVGSVHSYTMTHEGHTTLPDGRHLAAPETLRFRSADEIRDTLSEAGFGIEDSWGDWDRSPAGPTQPELIVLATRR
ncbi:MAG: class I SAM-dependent methyltransferase [Actinomycetota bacterium]